MEVVRHPVMDDDIVSTSREKLEKFIRELHRVTTYVKILEFYFLSALLTPNRRNYSDLQLLQEGNLIPESERLAVMGMPINKSTLPEDIKSEMQDILVEDILSVDNIDQVAIMKKLVILEKKIYDSIMAKETKYYKPDNIAAVSSYDKNPLEINGVVAAMIYNELRDDDMPALNLEERNKIIKVKINVDKNSALRIKDKYPETYEKLIALLDSPTLGKKVKIIGFPVDAEIPDWVLEFVDYTTIINDNLKNFPLESIGLRRFSNDNVNYSNIISL